MLRVDLHPSAHGPDLLAHDTLRDPYEIYDRLRREDPVHRSPAGYWVLFRYDDVRSALLDGRFSNRPASYSLLHPRNRRKHVAAGVANRLMAFMDAPNHTAVRSEIVSELGRQVPRVVAEMEPMAAHLVAGLPVQREFDLVETFAKPFSARLAARLGGYPDELAGHLARWASDFFLLFHAIPDRDTFRRLNESLEEFRACTHELLVSRKQAPARGMASALASRSGNVISEDEAIDNLMLLVADAYGNVQAGLSTCVARLIENGALEVARSPWFDLIDECLRLESPSQFQGRITREPVDIDGRTVPAQSLVYLGLASANRDPAVFPEPASFNPTRRNRSHLAFGLGAHKCVGGALVRGGLATALSALSVASWSMSLSTEFFDWEARPGHRWLKSLLVTPRGI